MLSAGTLTLGRPSLLSLLPRPAKVGSPPWPVPSFTLNLTGVPRTDRLGCTLLGLVAHPSEPQTADGISQQERSTSLAQR